MQHSLDILRIRTREFAALKKIQNSVHRLDLEDAARGLLMSIRTLRVRTNVDSNEYSLQWR